MSSQAEEDNLKSPDDDVINPGSVGQDQSCQYSFSYLSIEEEEDEIEKEEYEAVAERTNVDDTVDDSNKHKQQLEQQQQKRRHVPDTSIQSKLSYLEDEPEEEDDYIRKDDLRTPLLAPNDSYLDVEPSQRLLAEDDNFIELEPSDENLETLVDRDCKKKTIWNKVISGLKNQWLDGEEGNGGVDTNRRDEGGLQNNGDGNNNGNQKFHMNTSIAAVFLRDYECSRPCTLSPNIHSITPIQLEMYNLRFSPLHQFLVCVAIVTLFLGSFLEGQWRHDIGNFICQMLFTAFSTTILTKDIVLRSHYDDDNLFTANMQTLYTRKTRARKWKVPMLIMLFTVTLESAIKILFTRNTLIVWSSIFKPIVFFYASAKARDGELFILTSSIVFHICLC